jgi:hypothetical protein
MVSVSGVVSVMMIFLDLGPKVFLLKALGCAICGVVGAVGLNAKGPAAGLSLFFTNNYKNSRLSITTMPTIFGWWITGMLLVVCGLWGENKYVSERKGLTLFGVGRGQRGIAPEQ